MPPFILYDGRCALERLREAEVVVYDRLVNPALLDEAPPGALLIFAGKRVGSHCTAQSAINALLIHHAEAATRFPRRR